MDRGDHNARSAKAHALDRLYDRLRFALGPPASPAAASYVAAPCEWDQVRVGLLSWHTVGVPMTRAMVLPRAAMATATTRGTGTTM